LRIAGQVSEVVDVLLIDRMPVADTQLLSLVRKQILDATDVQRGRP
jgi:hypothetical protein